MLENNIRAVKEGTENNNMLKHTNTVQRTICLKEVNFENNSK